MSMVGVLTAAGLAGGLAMIVAQVTKQQMQTQKKSETGVEVVAMSQRIVRTLYDGDACLNTIGAGTAISAGGSITVNAIKNKKGEDVYKSLDNDPNAPAYGNRLLKVKSLKVVVPPSPNPITGDQAEAELEVVMRRESSAYTGQKTVTKKFPITLELDASKQLTGCVSDVSAIADPVKKEAKKEICLELGGNWGGTPEQCTYERICPQGQYLESFGKAGKVCKPLPLALPSCTQDQTIGYDSTGTPECRSAVTGGKPEMFTHRNAIMGVSGVDLTNNVTTLANHLNCSPAQPKNSGYSHYPGWGGVHYGAGLTLKEGWYQFTNGFTRTKPMIVIPSTHSSFLPPSSQHWSCSSGQELSVLRPEGFLLAQGKVFGGKDDTNTNPTSGPTIGFWYTRGQTWGYYSTVFSLMCCSR